MNFLLCTAELAAFICFFAQLIKSGRSIKCYHCSNKVGPCNTGECIGSACVKVEATTNQKTSVQKGCLGSWAKPSCIRTDFLGVEALKCVCTTDWCNDDTKLTTSGLLQDIKGNVNTAISQLNPERSKRTNEAGFRTLSWSPNYILMLIFMCLFVVVSFTLLIMNTVCIHLC